MPFQSLHILKADFPLTRVNRQTLEREVIYVDHKTNDSRIWHYELVGDYLCFSAALDGKEKSLCRIRTDGRFLKESAIDPVINAKVTALAELAKKRGQSLTKMALAYVASKPAVERPCISDFPDMMFRRCGRRQSSSAKCMCPIS